MVNVSEELTLQVALLARLELSEKEVKTFTPQLGEILKYIDQLQKVNVDSVEPLTQPFENKILLREDRAREFDKNLNPEGYKVPQIVG